MSKYHPRFAGMGGHQSAKSKTEEWYTPPETIEHLGGWRSFDLDPCAPEKQPYPTALRTYTKAQNGLILPWQLHADHKTRVLLNPPYNTQDLFAFMARMADHGCGTALIFARTETEAFHRFVWQYAHALLFIRGRMNFRTPDGTPALRKDGKTPANAGAPSVLCAYGVDDMDILAACEIDGQFVPLRIPRSVLALHFEDLIISGKDNLTWAEALDQFFVEREGPVHLDEAYRYFAGHRKAATNPNYKAKIRQKFQEGPYRNVGRGLWERANGDAA